MFLFGVDTIKNSFKKHGNNEIKIEWKVEEIGSTETFYEKTGMRLVGGQSGWSPASLTIRHPKVKV